MTISVTQLPAWQAGISCSNVRSMATEETQFSATGDEALMLQVGRGDDSALVKLIDRWKNPLINFFYRSLKSFEQAEDLAQMVFIRIYKASPNYRPTAKFSTFLFHIARRLLINEYRRQSRKPLEMMDPADLKAIDPNPRGLSRMEIEEIFELTLEKIPEKQKTAILLLKQQELSYQEIATVMDASESAVKTWIFRARQHLKEALKEVL